MKYIHFDAMLRRSITTTIIIMTIIFSFFPLCVAESQREGLDEFGLGSGQIQITSDQLIADSEENSAEFIGNVRAVQKDTTITSNRMKIYFKKSAKETKEEPAPDALLKIVISGNVEIKFDNRVAVTQEAVYIAEEKRLVLRGPNTKITSGKDTISGEKITYFRDKGRIQVEGGQGNRVEALIYPGPKE